MHAVVPLHLAGVEQEVQQGIEGENRDGRTGLRRAAKGTRVLDTVES